MITPNPKYNCDGPGWACVSQWMDVYAYHLGMLGTKLLANKEVDELTLTEQEKFEDLTDVMLVVEGLGQAAESGAILN